ncbi:MAG: ABC transporter permease subunit [bacterium]
MTAYIGRRLIGAIPTILIIVTFAFFMMRIAPGGPFDAERALPPDVIRNIEAKYHLDEPLHVQYWRYMKDLFRGDLGPSFKSPDWTVNEMVARTLPVSLILGTWALLFALCIGIPAGFIAALRRNAAPDYAAMTFAVIGISVPNFVVAALLMNLVAVKLGVLDVAGWGQWRHVVLPAVTLGLPYAAYIARLSRAGMLEVIRQDYVRTARAKGLSEPVILLRHAFKPAILPVVSFLGPAAAAILTGSLVVEKIFQIPGLGWHFVTSALNRDYTMVMGTVIVYSSMLILFNLLVDVAYGFLDPRIRYD